MRTIRTWLIAIYTAACSIDAAAIPLTNLQASVLGAASITDAGLAFPFDDFAAGAPPAALPITGDATAVSGTGSSGFAFAAAGANELTVTTEILMDPIGADLDASAVATAQLSGDFVPTSGVTQLSLTLDHVAAATLGSVATELVARILDAGGVLFEQAFAFGAPDSRLETLTRQVPIAAGTMATLELVLFTEALAGPTGSASAIGNAGFELTAVQPAARVPEPGSTMLWSGGLLALVLAARVRYRMRR